MKPLVIYHDHCTDGFGAAFAAWMKFGDDAEYLPMSYGDKRVVHYDEGLEFPAALIDRDVYILDFSFSKEITESIMNLADRVIWLDHHKTAFEMWCGKYEKGVKYEAFVLDPNNVNKEHIVELDDNRSGALIAWEYFHPNVEVPMLIKHIDDRDRWQFKLEGSKELHAALALYKPWSFEGWKNAFVAAEGFESLEPFYSEGSAVLRAHEQNVKTIVESGRRECIIPVYDNLTTDSHIPAGGLAANCPPYAASDVGHELANQSGTFGLCWYMGRDGKAKVSLRSNGDYDVSVIAKSFGGGGHLNASGMEVPMETLMGWLK